VAQKHKKPGAVGAGLRVWVEREAGYFWFRRRLTAAMRADPGDLSNSDYPARWRRRFRDAAIDAHPMPMNESVASSGTVLIETNSCGGHVGHGPDTQELPVGV